MSTPIYQEYESENIGRSYPFSADSNLTDADGVALPQAFLVDAVLYPASGMCNLESIVLSDDRNTATIVVSGMRGTFSADSRTVELFDANGFHRGTLVLGNGAKELFSGKASRTYENARFAETCQFELPGDGVSSAVFSGVDTRGRIEFISGGSTAVIKPVVDKDENSIRFDVVPANKGLGGTGVNTLYVVRKPGSLFNIMDKDGEPYLYLTSTGFMDQYSLIDREDICARSDDSAAIKDYKEKNSKVNCGVVPGVVPVPTGVPVVNDVERIVAGSTGREIRKKCVSDKAAWDSKLIPPPYTVVSYSWNGSSRLGGGQSTMTVMNIEREIWFKFSFPLNGWVCVDVFFKDTYSTMRLFGDKIVNDYTIAQMAGDGRVNTGAGYVRTYNDGLGMSGNMLLCLKPSKYREFYEYFVMRGNGGLGFLGRKEIVDICAKHGWLSGDIPYDYFEAQERNTPIPPGTAEDWGVSQDEFDEKISWRMTELIKQRLAADGLLNKAKLVYIVPAKSFFEHFGCKNWEISENVCDEARWLVGWFEGNDKVPGGNYFSGGNMPLTFTGGDGKEYTYSRTGISRLVWWKRHSKNGNQMRLFLLPPGRGITVFTGDFWAKDYRDYTKSEKYAVLTDIRNAPYWNRPETYHDDWSCALSHILYTGDASLGGGYPCMADHLWWGSFPEDYLYKDYTPEYDPTFKYMDDVFDEKTLDALDRTCFYYNNRVDTDSQEIVQPVDSPIYRDKKADKCFYGSTLVGPMRYADLDIVIPDWKDLPWYKDDEEPDEYDYTEPDEPDEPDEPEEPEEVDILRDDVVLKYRMTADRRNMLSFNVTDFVADDVSYNNPIHVAPVTGFIAPASVDISDPTDYHEVGEEIGNLVKTNLKNTGVEISVPGV